jgi:ATP-dependent DNA ligase
MRLNVWNEQGITVWRRLGGCGCDHDLGRVLRSRPLYCPHDPSDPLTVKSPKSTRAHRSEVKTEHKPFARRRPLLEDFAARHFTGGNLFRLSPASRKLQDAHRWLASAGGGSDGVIAKRLDLAYQAGNRGGMQKIKRYRSADCVIGGFRYGENVQAGRKVVGSILRGLYDAEGLLHHVGFSSGIKAKDKPALTDKLKAIMQDRSFTGNAPGGPSRWSTKRTSEWQPVKPKCVVEVSYDHFTSGRFRHGTSILRRRPDKKPAQCTFEQLDQKIDRTLLSKLKIKGSARSA